MKRYLIRWKINNHLTFTKIFDAPDKKTALADAKKHYLKSMPLRAELWKAENLEVTELIEQGKVNGDEDDNHEDEENN